jgi:hypothetical protein
VTPPNPGRSPPPRRSPPSAPRSCPPVDYLEALIGPDHPTSTTRVNAITEVVEEAVTSARDAEKFYAKSTDDDLAEAAATKPLLGLPVIAKEKHAIAGRGLTQGLLHERDTVAEADAAIIAPHPRGGRLRPRSGDLAGVQLRDDHPLADVGRDPQSVEP